MGQLRVLMLDGLSLSNIKRYEMERLERITEEYNSSELKIDTYPHTVQSQTMIWSGQDTEIENWLYPKDGPVGKKDLIPREKMEDPDSNPLDNYTLLERSDYPMKFVWEILEAYGYDTAVDGIPVIFPPIVHNIAEKFIDRYWLPATYEEMRKHLAEKRRSLMYHASADLDAYFTVVQVPDKWDHMLIEGKTTEDRIRTGQAVDVDKMVNWFVKNCSTMDKDWVILGDHGSPMDDDPHYHEKESVIISNLETVPESNRDVFDWMLDYFDVQRDAPGGPKVEEIESEIGFDSVDEVADKIVRT